MASPSRPGLVGAGEAFLLALAVLFPLGPRFGTGVGNIYLATVLTLAWLAAWALFVFLGPRGGLSLATGPQRALLAYAGFLVFQVLLHLGGLLERPAFLFRAVQLVAYMGLFVTVASIRMGLGTIHRLVRLSLVVLLIECAIAWATRGSARHGFLAGTFDNEHNSFAAYLVLMVPLILALASFAQNGWSRTLLVLLCALGVVSVAFSLSRTAYLALPAALLAVIYRRWGKRAFLATLVSGIVIVVLAGLALPENVRERFSSILAIASGEEQDISFLTRLALWRGALEEFVRTGGIGVGIYGFQYLDSYFIRALVETGVLGFVLFLVLLVLSLRWLSRSYDRAGDPDTRSLALGLYGATIGLLVVANFATDTFLVHRVMGLYWVLFGSLVAVHVSLPREREPGPTASPC
jgi:O-antigen ligase